MTLDDIELRDLTAREPGQRRLVRVVIFPRPGREVGSRALTGSGGTNAHVPAGVAFGTPPNARQA